MLNLRMSHFFFGITSTDLKKKTFFFEKMVNTWETFFEKRWKKAYQWGKVYGENRGNSHSMAGRGDFEKKNGKNVKMLHAGVFLNSKNENQYSGFP